MLTAEHLRLLEIIATTRMGPIPKFNLIPASQVERKSGQAEYRATIKKGNLLYFPRDVVETYSLGGKYARFYLDTQKKVLAWKMLNGEYHSPETFKRGGDVKRFTVNKANGNIVISISSFIESLGMRNLQYPVSNVPVRIYKSSLLEGEMKYIDLKEAKRITS